MNKILKKFNKMNTTQKIEFVLASILSLALMIGMPVYAWFANVNNMETMTKIKEPENLDIRAGHYHSIINFELSDISIEDMYDTTNNVSKPEYRVFSVSAGDYKIPYKLQLAYTTNIPFKYSIYKATEVDSEGADTVPYKPIYKDLDDPTTDGKTYYYKIGENVSLSPLNADSANKAYYGRKIAKNGDTYYNKTYEDENDAPEIYAVPVYLQSTTITPTDKGEDAHDYFILKIEWDQESAATNFTKWNKAENNKETDIIYITASRSTG